MSSEARVLRPPTLGALGDGLGAAAATGASLQVWPSGLSSFGGRVLAGFFLRGFPSDPSMPACMLSRFSHVQLFVTPGSVALQPTLSMGFSWQDYWSGLPCPPPEDLPNPGIKPTSLVSPALAGSFFTTNATWEALPKP